MKLNVFPCFAALLAAMLLVTNFAQAEPRKSDVRAAVEQGMPTAYGIHDFIFKVFPIPGGQGRVSVEGTAVLEEDLYDRSDNRHLRAAAIARGVPAGSVDAAIRQVTVSPGGVRLPEYGIKYKKGIQTSFTAELTYKETVSGFSWTSQVNIKELSGLPRERITYGFIHGTRDFDRVLDKVVQTDSANRAMQTRQTSYIDQIESDIKTYFKDRAYVISQQVSTTRREHTDRLWFTCPSVQREAGNRGEMVLVATCDAVALGEYTIGESRLRSGDKRKIQLRIVVLEDQRRNQQNGIFPKLYIKGETYDSRCSDPSRWCTHQLTYKYFLWNGEEFKGDNWKQIRRASMDEPKSSPQPEHGIGLKGFTGKWFLTNGGRERAEWLGSGSKTYTGITLLIEKNGTYRFRWPPTNKTLIKGTWKESGQDAILLTSNNGTVTLEAVSSDVVRIRGQGRVKWHIFERRSP